MNSFRLVIIPTRLYTVECVSAQDRTVYNTLNGCPGNLLDFMSCVSFITIADAKGYFRILYDICPYP